MVHGADTAAPCPSILWRDGRALCEVILMEQAGIDAGVLSPEGADRISTALGIGWGCDSSHYGVDNKGEE
jgi:hypothetical protein